MAQWINDPACVCGSTSSIPGPTPWMKALSWPWLLCRLLLRLRFDPWPGNFYLLWVHLKKKKSIYIILMMICDLGWACLNLINHLSIVRWGLICHDDKNTGGTVCFGIIHPMHACFLV